jgi:hypothetical protein
MKDDPQEAKDRIKRLSFEARLELLCQAPVKDKLTLLELAEDRIRLVRALPKSELFFAVQELGREGAIELISRASLDQINFMVDLDCWKKDQIDLDKLREWIKTLLECSPRKLISWMQKADPELLIFFFQKHIKVVKPDNPSDPDDPAFKGLPRELYLTLDQQYFLEFIGPADMQNLIYQLLNLIFSIDYSFYFTIMEGVIWELGMELEEGAKHWRQARLEDAGFPPLEEALEIYQHLNPDRFAPQLHKKIYSCSEQDTPLKPSSPEGLIPFRSYLSSRTKDSFLLKSLDYLKSQPYFTILQQELITLFNKILLVEIEDFSQTEEIKRAFELGHNYLNIGLEYLAGGNIDRSRELLRDIRLQKLFQVGFNLVKKLQKQARQIRSELQKNPPSSDPEERALRLEAARVLTGLLKRHPLLYERESEEMGKAIYRPIENMKDLSSAQEKLAELARLYQPSSPKY